MGTLWHLKSARRPTGGRVRRKSKKKRMQRGMFFLETDVDKRKVKPVRTRGGRTKIKLLSCDIASVADKKTGKTKKVKILSVKESETSPHYVRRNIITKGELIETEIGLAEVTSRPGQDGVVNAVLVNEKK